MGQRDLIAVDPGVHFCGVAEFIDGTLCFAELRKSTAPLACTLRIICEIPQVYTRDKSKGDPNDLIQLACVAGWMCGPGATYIKPAAWKGQLPKQIMHARMFGVLTQSELDVLDALDCKGSLRHNVYDAVCIGLVHLGRS